VSNELNRDHRCRTCEHWCAPYFPEHWGLEQIWDCECQLPFFCEAPKDGALVRPTDGENCGAYAYSYRRARLVKP